MAPPVQGYLVATYEDMAAVFGEPGKADRDTGFNIWWKLPAGTMLHDLALDGVPPRQQHCWHIAGWSPASVEQVIGLLVRAGRFWKVEKPPSRAKRETVFTSPADTPVTALARHCVALYGLAAILTLTAGEEPPPWWDDRVSEEITDELAGLAEQRDVPLDGLLAALAVEAGRVAVAAGPGPR